MIENSGRRDKDYLRLALTPVDSLFDDPDEDERQQYVRYWQDKIKNNKKIKFPDDLVIRIAVSTSKFSFAVFEGGIVSEGNSFDAKFLKCVLFSVSTLVVLAGAKK